MNYSKMMFQQKSYFLSIMAIFSYMVIVQCGFKNNSLDCHKDVLTEMDKHLRSMEFINGEQHFPETFKELKEHCG